MTRTTSLKGIPLSSLPRKSATGRRLPRQMPCTSLAPATTVWMPPASHQRANPSRLAGIAAALTSRSCTSHHPLRLSTAWADRGRLPPGPRPITPAAHPCECGGISPGRSKRKPRVSALSDLVGLPPVPPAPADIGHEHPRLARDVRADVPRCPCLGVEGRIGEFANVARPVRFRFWRCLDAVQPPRLHAGQAVADPVDVLLDRHHHVAEDARAAGPSDHEKVRESRHA